MSSDPRPIPTFKLSDKAVKKAYELLPDYMVPALLRYWNDRLKPGDFLLSILANDLLGAIMHADDINKHELHNYVNWLYNWVPARPNGWGSKEAVDTWLNN